MTDPRRWILALTRAEPPALWEEVLRRGHLGTQAVNKIAVGNGAVATVRTNGTFVEDRISRTADDMIQRGRERGFVTSEDLVDAISVDDLTPEQLEDVLTSITDHLKAESIEVIEVPGDDSDVVSQIRAEVDALKPQTNDLVRMYLKD